MNREYRLARASDFVAIGRMLELYQYELSDIWDQDLDTKGEYGFDLDRHVRAERSFAHIALVEGRYAGVALVAPAIVTRTDGHWMEQFFVLKKYRRCGHGLALARHVLDCHPGPWEIGQMPGNVAARAFWRSVISRLTAGNFSEVEVTQGWWQGTVQRFVHQPL
jgi:predicted acetyltransferase